MEIKRIGAGVVVTTLVVLTLAGCEIGTPFYTPAMDIKKAVLYSPRGEFEFKTVESPSSTKRTPRWTTTAYDGQYGIIIRFFPTGANSGSIDFVSETKDIKVEKKSSFYQFNNGRKNHLDIEQIDHVGYHRSNFAKWWHKAHSITNKASNKRYFRTYLDILHPPPQVSQYRNSGGSLKIRGTDNYLDFIDEDHLEKIAKEWYRYHITFSINGAPYTIDVTFKLRIDKSLRAAVPGMG